MAILLEILKEYGTQISAIGAAFAFVFGVFKYISDKRADRYWKEYEAYHRLVKDLVEPSNEKGEMFADRQSAAVFELRFYKKYFPHTLRMLKALRKVWGKNQNSYKRLIEEIDLTIAYIEKRL